MPAVSKDQREFMGAELRRKREGKDTITEMTEEQLEDFASTPEANLPKRKPQGRGHGGRFGPSRTTRTSDERD